MLRKVGSERTSRDDLRLAAYLASIAGVVNSAGFIILGSFTSHVTGNLGRFVDHAVDGSSATATIAGATVAAFFVGALTTSMAIESAVLGHTSRTSCALLLLEALAIGLVVPLAGPHRTDGIHELPAILLGFAMGIQNSLVTRLSGAVVRTTHLTGIVTDLAIETARWFRYWRSRLGARGHLRLTVSKVPAVRPSPEKVALLATIVAAFVVGSMSGAALAVGYRERALLLPVLLLVIGACYALVSGRSLVRNRTGQSQMGSRESWSGERSGP